MHIDSGVLEKQRSYLMAHHESEWCVHNKTCNDNSSRTCQQFSGVSMTPASFNSGRTEALHCSNCTNRKRAGARASQIGAAETGRTSCFHASAMPVCQECDLPSKRHIDIARDVLLVRKHQSTTRRQSRCSQWLRGRKELGQSRCETPMATITMATTSPRSNACR